MPPHMTPFGVRLRLNELKNRSKRLELTRVMYAVADAGAHWNVTVTKAQFPIPT